MLGKYLPGTNCLFRSCTENRLVFVPSFFCTFPDCNSTRRSKGDFDRIGTRKRTPAFFCDHRSRTKCLHLNSPHPAWRARSHSHRPLNIPEFIILERVEPSSRSFPFPLAESQSKPPLLEDPGWREEKRGERIRIYLPRLWDAATARDLETQRKRRTSTFLPRPVSRYNLS